MGNWNKEHPEKMREANARWLAANKDIKNDRRREWRKNNREKDIDTRRKLMFNLNREQLLQVFNLQNGLCALGNESLDFYGTETHLDHDHNCCPSRKSCGKCFRGFLCRKHNNGLGFFNHDVKIFEAAITYLKGVPNG